jgi:threonine/homoserine/homoserine lactone efflux protein
VVFGVAALLAVSVTAFTVFKVVGALYLFWLGILAFREAFRKHVTRPLDSEATEAPTLAEFAPSAPAPFVTMLQRWGPARLGASPFAQGVVSAITNPKMAVFMLTFLPQYLDPTGFVIVQAVLLTIIMAIVNIVWLSLYVFALGFVAPVLRRPRVRRFQEGLLGTVFVSFGLRLATASQ